MELNKNYSGKTQLRDWWGIVKSNFDNVESTIKSHDERILNVSLNMNSSLVKLSYMEANVGDKSELLTENTDSLVDAINELYTMINNINTASQNGGE